MPSTPWIDDVKIAGEDLDALQMVFEIKRCGLSNAAEDTEVDRMIDECQWQALARAHRV